MKKDIFFIKALQLGWYVNKIWIIKAFSIIKDEGLKKPTSIDWDIKSIDGFWYGFLPEKEYVQLLDNDNKPIPSTKPLFAFNESLKITEDDIINLKQRSIMTTYGRFLANYILLVFPFKDKLEYINDELKISKIESLIVSRLVDDNSPEANDPKNITVQEFKQYSLAASQLEGFAQLCVPTVTEKSLTTDPKIKEVVQQLKEQYKGQLNDPAVIAKIDAAVEQMDRAWIKGDPSERFYIKDKAYQITRKKMLGSYGGEAGLGDGTEMDFIDKPLTEGLDIEHLPAMINSLRSGSYDRGTQTALGGVAVKEFFRVFQNSNISQKDCGSKVGILRNVRNDNFKEFIGLYHIENNAPVLINEENVKSLIGKIVNMRSPATCKTPLTDYCETCMGLNNSMNKTGLGAAASEIGSKFMSMMLRSMHGKSLSLAHFNVKENIV